MDTTQDGALPRGCILNAVDFSAALIARRDSRLYLAANKIVFVRARVLHAPCDGISYYPN
jgi:hypothetical protein